MYMGENRWRLHEEKLGCLKWPLLILGIIFMFFTERKK
ncbi:MAG: hypothetical protein BWY57_02976 [Betaproteobacteria bacterium ADurb.Bin341]|nr:MAG: hypothetical protein BWY57_02976 [Betaproteobacteria bacterium ADurb.Bin341]